MSGWSGVIRCLALSVLLMAGGARKACAQEVQIPFDRAGSIQVLDAERAERLGLFVDEVPGFLEARLFQVGDSVRLEILARRNGSTVRTTRTLTAVEHADLRQRISMGPPPSEVEPSANARTLLLTSSTLLGLTVYGPALPIAFDVDDSKSATALYMATASASFFVPWILTKDVTPAMAQAGYYGSTRGFAHGAALHYLIAGGDDVDCNFEDCRYVRNTLASGVAVGVAEAIGGYIWARDSRMTGGEANAISLGGDWGLMNGLGLAVVTGLADGDSEDDSDRPTVALALAGAAGGLAAGHLLSPRRDYTYGDVEVLGTTGWLGTYVAWAIADETDGAEKVEAAAAMAGGAAGILLADRLVARSDFTYGQSALVRLGTLAGGLLGYGTGVLIASDSSTDSALPSAIGALAGFFATHRAVGRSARVGLASEDLQFDIAPLGVAALLAPAGMGVPDLAMPVATVRYRF